MVRALSPSAEMVGCHGTTNSGYAEAWLCPALCKGTPLQICLVSPGSECWNTLLKLFGRKAGKGDRLGLK